MRNVIGSDVKMCFLRCDQRTKFTGKETKEILKTINNDEITGAELQWCGRKVQPNVGNKSQISDAQLGLTVEHVRLGS